MINKGVVVKTVIRIIVITHHFVYYDDVIKWKHFSHYMHFVRGIHRSPVDSPHKDQWRGALMFNLVCTWTNSWANKRVAGDVKRHCAHYDVIVMKMYVQHKPFITSTTEGHWKLKVSLYTNECWSNEIIAVNMPVLRVAVQIFFLYPGKLFNLHSYTGLILGLRPANERRRYFVTTSLIGWLQA